MPSPSGLWILTYGLPLETDLNQDLNGDGVTLLIAYALALDPNSNLGGSLPVPATDANTLSISYHAASDGITYTVESSTDLRERGTSGVSLSGIGPDGQQTASVALGAGEEFLRLVVSESE